MKRSGTFGTVKRVVRKPIQKYSVRRKVRITKVLGVESYKRSLVKLFSVHFFQFVEKSHACYFNFLPMFLCS